MIAAQTRSINNNWWSNKNLKQRSKNSRDSTDYVSQLRPKESTIQAVSATGHRGSRDSPDNELAKYQLAGMR